MTTNPVVRRLYFPSNGQPDGATRAAALSCVLMGYGDAIQPRYAPFTGTLPCVVLDSPNELQSVVEPTTLAAVDAAQDQILVNRLPTTAVVSTSLTSAITAHSAASNPHNITTSVIGAAPTSHSHVDADIPAAIARDAEVAAAYSTLTHNHDTAYSTLAHTHALPAAGAIRKTGNQTMTATAQTAVTDMSFAVAANATYYFSMEVLITTSSGTAPTSAWGFTGPASPTAVSIMMVQDTSSSTQADAAITAFGNYAAGAQAANTAVKFSGVVQTSAGNAGTVALTCARGGTTPSMVLAQGSVGHWLRVA